MVLSTKLVHQITFCGSERGCAGLLPGSGGGCSIGKYHKLNKAGHVVVRFCGSGSFLMYFVCLQNTLWMYLLSAQHVHLSTCVRLWGLILYSALQRPVEIQFMTKFSNATNLLTRPVSVFTSPWDRKKRSSQVHLLTCLSTLNLWKYFHSA